MTKHQSAIDRGLGVVAFYAIFVATMWAFITLFISWGWFGLMWTIPISAVILTIIYWTIFATIYSKHDRGPIAVWKYLFTGE